MRRPKAHTQINGLVNDLVRQDAIRLPLEGDEMLYMSALLLILRLPKGAI